MFQPKEKDWLVGCKSKPPIYAVSIRPTSNLVTHTDWKWGAGEEKKNHPNADQKKTGPAMFISIK